jgi:hypothetical protein
LYSILIFVIRLDIRAFLYSQLFLYTPGSFRFAAFWCLVIRKLVVFGLFIDKADAVYPLLLYRLLRAHTILLLNCQGRLIVFELKVKVRA